MTNREQTPEISVKDLGLIYRKKQSKRQGGDLAFTALQAVNLDVAKGEFISVVGPSGCGKSTFLYILAGLHKQTSGVAYINGEEITGPSLDRGIIMQAYALFPWRTILKNVEFGLEEKKIPRAERERIAREYIELVGLSNFADHYPYELSGGMKQRIAIARALAYNPDVLLMDEPFAAVDEQTRGLLHDELLRIWEQTHKTIIFVTHSIDEAVLLSDRVAVMTPSPGTIRKIVEIDLARPRTSALVGTEVFRKNRNKVWQLLQVAGAVTREVQKEDGRRVLDTEIQPDVIF
jgi:NitT/TauT family transport system ATP-binding protein